MILNKHRSENQKQMLVARTEKTLSGIAISALTTVTSCSTFNLAKAKKVQCTCIFFARIFNSFFSLLFYNYFLDVNFIILVIS